MAKKDSESWLGVLSGICGNLAAGWFGLILITPGIQLRFDFDSVFLLTRSFCFGILFMVLAFLFDRRLQWDR